MSGDTDALVAALLCRTPDAIVLATESTPWCSATFAGERYVVALSFANAAAATRFRDGLGNHEFSLASGFIAEICAGSPVRCGGRLHVSVEALTIDEA